MRSLLLYNFYFFVFLIHKPLKSVTGLSYAAVSPDVAGNHRNTVINGNNEDDLKMIASE